MKNDKKGNGKMIKYYKYIYFLWQKVGASYAYLKKGTINIIFITKEIEQYSKK